VSTVVAALVWRRVLEEIADGRLSQLVVPDPLEAEAAVREAFATVDPSGEMAAECWREHERKLRRFATAGERVALAAEHWPSHEPALRHLLAGAGSIVEALRAAGAPVDFSQLTPPVGRETAVWAVASCNLMRERFSVADLACFLGIWDEVFVDSLLSEANALGMAS
jgi:glycerol-1-phosphate dehydrogenase [NAD(P)+]